MSRMPEIERCFRAICGGCIGSKVIESRYMPTSMLAAKKVAIEGHGWGYHRSKNGVFMCPDCLANAVREAQRKEERFVVTLTFNDGRDKDSRKVVSTHKTASAAITSWYKARNNNGWAAAIECDDDDRAELQRVATSMSASSTGKKANALSALVFLLSLLSFKNTPNLENQ